VLAGHLVVGTSGSPRVESVTVAPLDRPGEYRTIACDLLAVSGGWSPAVHLLSQARGRLRYDEHLACFVPDGSGPHIVGAARGAFRLADCLSDGLATGARTAAETGFGDGSAPTPPAVDEIEETPPRALWAVPPPPGGDWSSHFVDLQRDATVADIRRAADAGMRSPEHVKRFTTIGTANDQGKTSGVITLGILADLLGVPLAELGPTTFRPPYVPVPFALLAGRDRGRLHDPVRVTPIHRWHVEHGAQFEDVGQWKRPWYYPRAGEDMDAAVLRECRAAREGVAVMDATTLGKIDVQGPNAATFLNRLYTGDFSRLAVGACKYGVMCKPDGMVLDDGVTMRLAEDRYLVTTTTGNAATVLDWFEEWLQTEWPDLRVHCTSVTEQWATVAIVGPRSRAVLARLAPNLDLDAERFPWMTLREGEVAGIPARVARVSFSGELAFEVNVAGWYGLALWEAVMEAGKPYDITPYGTETMHVLRAEKGFVIVGQETDGTVTPQDLGMDWAVSKKKGDFVGRRSHRRADTARADRKQLVGLLPDDPDVRLPEGAQLVLEPTTQIPAPMVGHVTSSYRSAALGRTFALALVKGGRERVGETVYSPLVDGIVAASVTEPVFYDREGRRRDGDGSDPPGNGAHGPFAAQRRSPLEHLADALAAASGPAVQLRELPFLPQFNLRGNADAELGFPLPGEPNTVTASGDRTALWLGPDEWLLVGPGPEPQAGTAVDVSANRTTIELRGPNARDVLMKGCSLDLHPRAFGPGRCAQTALARAAIVLHQASDEPAYRILVRCSFAEYLAEWLMDAASEFGRPVR
jgi:sarcosine oxidase subunit alpha